MKVDPTAVVSKGFSKPPTKDGFTFEGFYEATL